MNAGVTVAICCHNSASRLPVTLEHVMAQRAPGTTPWEALVIDNASSDHTAALAKELWRRDDVPFRVVTEKRPGLSHARETARRESRYELISFIDDDNWISPDWVELVMNVMRAHPEVGACGGIGEAVFETPPPRWFHSHQDNFAVGPQAEEPGYVPASRGRLYGAGLTIRKSAWAELIENGFTPRLVDRCGSSLSSGGDTELCVALMLGGWKLWYDPRLSFQHYMPASRVTWEYLRRLHRAFGEASVYFDSYVAVRDGQSAGWRGPLRQSWLWNFQTVVRNLLSRRRTLLLSRRQSLENDQVVIEVEGHLGRLRELLRQAPSYGRRRRAIRQWIERASHG